MDNVSIDKNQLVEIVKKNRDKHVEDYNEAVEDYKKAVLKVSLDNLELAQTGNLNQFERIKVLPPTPVSYETSYNKSLRMLELSVDSSITLDSHDFNQLVLDEWVWKNQFNLSNSAYKSLQ